MRKLHIGNIDGKPDKPFWLPLDFVTRTLAIMAIRGAGKTIAATVIAEEMCEAGIPWVAFDPVSVWWGLRAGPDGKAGGYPVIVIGGEHGDIPFQADKGAKIAEAIVKENLFCVLDMSLESKNTWRRFVTEFCDRMMEMRPPSVRHVFLEEAPEFIPQRPMGEQKRSLAAVDRLLRLGRNRGYGATIISQRFATVNKDVLTQACENIFAMRTIGKNDRDEAKHWIIESGIATDEAPLKEQLNTLATLPDGVGYFWSPQWLKIFERVQIRRRKTFHPGETRTVGGKLQSVKLAPMNEAIERLRSLLAGKKVAKPMKLQPDRMSTIVMGVPTIQTFHEQPQAQTTVFIPGPPHIGKTKEEEMADAHLLAENDRLKRELAELRTEMDNLREELRSLKRAPQSPAKTALGMKPPATDTDRLAASYATEMTGKVVHVPGDIDGLYEAFKAKIAADPGVLLLIKTARPELEVQVRRHVITTDMDSLRGRIGMLIHDGFFMQGRTASAVDSELNKRGFKTSRKANTYEEMDELTSMGFFRKEKAPDRSIRYVLMEDMKVNVREMSAV